MPLNLASPGIVVREVDLTIGRVDTATDKVGAIVAPFAKGPVNEPILVENEQDLLDNFGEPSETDKHFEHFMVAQSYLAYGGVMRVVRAGDVDLTNAYVGTASSIRIDSTEDYNNKGYDTSTITGVTFAARNPGSWGNGLKVALIDSKADQTLTIGISTLTVGVGVTQAVPAGTVVAGAGSTSLIDGYFKGIVTGVSGASVDVKFVAHVSTAGIETAKDYQPGGVYQFNNSGVLSYEVSSNAGGGSTTTVSTTVDWFDQQTIALSNSTIKWNNISDRPGTSAFAASRSSRFDEVHVVVYDDEGKVTGNAGTVLEKHLNLSKAKDAEFSAGTPAYWRKYLYNNSTNVFGGSAPAGITTTNFGAGNFTFASDNGWDQEAQGISFAGSGSVTSTLSGGKNYNGMTGIQTAGAFTVTIGDLGTGYDLFENPEEVDVDFLLMGSSNYTKEESQALANKIISVAELRKDAIAFVSPNRGSFLNDTAAGSVTVYSNSQITDNLVSYYAPVTSTTFGVFDSGYKYMYDRFNDTFRYVPMNGDTAGTCARNDINNFPWFSPAGTARGTILNAVKLAYNPNQTQRDTLYSNRINPIIFSPGAGIVLFGDKTGFGKASAFDRINVRRLFIYLENAIKAAARDQLFEFNDEITRTNFINIVEPFLRDVQSKRGIFDFRVICDETNNTAAIIDSNEFVADIFIKPSRSINFIGLTFVATRTGISFDEVIGSV
tara:strand:- start:1487 stop:3643 length:2157 start_codon:yes stop_codon:yes gene_type:complete